MYYQVQNLIKNYLLETLKGTIQFGISNNVSEVENINIPLLTSAIALIM